MRSRNKYEKIGHDRMYGSGSGSGRGGERKIMRWLEGSNFYYVLGIILLGCMLLFQVYLRIQTQRQIKEEFTRNYLQLKRFNQKQAQLYQLSNADLQQKQQSQPESQLSPSASPIKSNTDNTAEVSKTPKPAETPKKKQADKPTTDKQAPTVDKQPTTPDKPKPAPKPPATPTAATIAGIDKATIDFAKSLIPLKTMNLRQPNPVADKQRQHYEDKYKISMYNELPMCIVVPSYNNVQNKRYLNNINSILMQEYSNYHIVFIDDASTDQTSALTLKAIQNYGLDPGRYIMIRNEVKKNAMPNLRRAANEFCKPQEIYLIVDGDDQLLGRQVFKLFNFAFQSRKAWFVYSNFLTTRGSIGYSRPFPDRIVTANSYRRYPFVTSHLRAFYTQLFRNIKEEDLKDEKGEYLRAANDVAICIPILQQAHQKVTYLPEMTYIYNSNTGLNNHYLRLKEQKSNDKKLRSKPSYKPLKTLLPEKEEKQEEKDKEEGKGKDEEKKQGQNP